MSVASRRVEDATSDASSSNVGRSSEIVEELFAGVGSLEIHVLSQEGVAFGQEESSETGLEFDPQLHFVPELQQTQHAERDVSSEGERTCFRRMLLLPAKHACGYSLRQAVFTVSASSQIKTALT